MDEKDRMQFTKSKSTMSNALIEATLKNFEPERDTHVDKIRKPVAGDVFIFYTTDPKKCIY